MNKNKPKVAFLCTHNACRSQIAEALGRKLAGDAFEPFSAGTEKQDHLDPGAVKWMKELHGVDMEKTQRSKTLRDIPAPGHRHSHGLRHSLPGHEGRLRRELGA